MAHPAMRAIAAPKGNGAMAQSSRTEDTTPTPKTTRARFVRRSMRRER